MNDGNVEADVWAVPEEPGFDLLLIGSLGVIAFSATVIAMTVSIMLS